MLVMGQAFCVWPFFLHSPVRAIGAMWWCVFLCVCLGVSADLIASGAVFYVN
jgi:hypothetical protein